ncbi:MAG TPA: EamA family transporter [Humisphaera sp.]
MTPPAWFPPTWLVYALLSALCASVVGLLGKKGMAAVDPTLATAVRSVIMTALLVAVSFATGAAARVRDLSPKPLLLITLSGAAGALSWLFMFRALASPGGDVSRVAPVDKLSMPIGVVLAVLLLSERPTTTNWVGIGLVVVGVYLAAARG